MTLLKIMAHHCSHLEKSKISLFAPHYFLYPDAERSSSVWLSQPRISKFSACPAIHYLIIEKPGQIHKTLLFFCPRKVKTHGSGVVRDHRRLHQGDGFGMRTEVVQSNSRPELDTQPHVQFQLIVHQLTELEQVTHLS